MTTFDDVLPSAIGTLAATADIATLETIVVVRDVTGCVRLVVHPRPTGASPDFDSLQGRMAKALGGYFKPPIFSTAMQGERGRLARTVLERSLPWPDGWPTQYTDPVTNGTVSLPAECLRAVQRVLSKEVWLSRSAGPPWPLAPGKTPRVISFYSFKGGVGRSTIVGLVARRLARAGHRVTVLDLDLEAPGASVLLDAMTPRGQGILDFVVDHIATGSAELTDLHAPPQALPPEESRRVEVFPAGRLDWGYLEKLGRLDFASGDADTNQESPVETALRSLLKLVRDRLSPDFILIDSRAGLHDLAGLSLHALSHVDVLVSRGGPQAMAGLRLTIEALARRRKITDWSCIVVHTFVPTPIEGAVAKAERDEFKEQVYSFFEEHIYARGTEDTPDREDPTAWHFPMIVPELTELARARTIRDIPESVVDSEAFTRLTDHLIELCEPDEDEEA